MLSVMVDLMKYPIGLLGSQNTSLGKYIKPIPGRTLSGTGWLPVKYSIISLISLDLSIFVFSNSLHALYALKKRREPRAFTHTHTTQNTSKDM